MRGDSRGGAGKSGEERQAMLRHSGFPFLSSCSLALPDHTSDYMLALARPKVITGATPNTIDLSRWQRSLSKQARGVVSRKNFCLADLFKTGRRILGIKRFPGNKE